MARHRAAPTAGSNEPSPALIRLHFGNVKIDANRAGRDMGRIAEEVFQHLTILLGSSVHVTVEIEADMSDYVMRIVSENGQTPRLKAQGFERG